MMKFNSKDPASPGNWFHSKRLWVPVFMMAGLTVLSFNSRIQTGGWSFPGLDKLAHLLVYGLLGIAWVRSLQAARFSIPARLGATVLLAAGFGLWDEFNQLHTPGRYFEWSDLQADALGALIFSAAYLCLQPMQDILELEFRVAGRLRFDAKTTNSSK